MYEKEKRALTETLQKQFKEQSEALKRQLDSKIADVARMRSVEQIRLKKLAQQKAQYEHKAITEKAQQQKEVAIKKFEKRERKVKQMEFIEKRLDQMEKYKPLFYGGDTEQQLKKSQTE